MGRFFLSRWDKSVTYTKAPFRGARAVGTGRLPAVTPRPMPLPKRHRAELRHHARDARRRASRPRAPCPAIIMLSWAAQLARRSRRGDAAMHLGRFRSTKTHRGTTQCMPLSGAAVRGRPP